MYLIDRDRPNRIINEVIRFGADPNYLDPNYKGHERDKKTALSVAIDSLPSGEYITGYFYFGSANRDNTARKISMVNNLIDRTNQIRNLQKEKKELNENEGVIILFGTEEKQ